ncbi:MAG: LysR family transcriptional regulator [Gammaproteobacteria bacterium]
MDLVDGLKAFVATAQTGSFTAAADRLGISNRLTSKYVAELENRIGARLLQRTTRKVGLTPAGQALLARAPALLDELDDLLGSVSEESKGLSGLLRIAAPVTFGEIYLKDLLGRFAARHPEVTLDLRLSDAFVDLATEGFDLAFRIGTPEIASLKVRRLGATKIRVVASPEYLARRAAPCDPQDLQHHLCIVDTNRVDATRWRFLQRNREITVSVPHRLKVNSARVARDWAVAGHGIAYCPDFVLHRDIAEGRLVPLLERHEIPAQPINAVYLQGHILPRKVRALIDFAVEAFRDVRFD